MDCTSKYDSYVHFKNDCYKYFGTKNIYAILGVTSDATPMDVRKGYYKFALITHPDHVDDEMKEEASERFKLLNNIYSVLKDPVDKLLYDMFGIVNVGYTRNSLSLLNSMIKRGVIPHQVTLAIEFPSDMDMEAGLFMAPLTMRKVLRYERTKIFKMYIYRDHDIQINYCKNTQRISRLTVTILERLLDSINKGFPFRSFEDVLTKDDEEDLQLRYCCQLCWDIYTNARETIESLQYYEDFEE